jgi:hypothetical protein
MSKANSKPCLFFSDYPPLTNAGGCHFLALLFQQGFNPDISCLLTRRFSRKRDPSDIMEASVLPVVFWKDLSLFGLRRPYLGIRYFLDTVAFALQLGSIKRRLAGRNIQWIFALSGNEPFFLIQARLLGWTLNVPVHAYLVDDFEESAVLHRDNFTRLFTMVFERRILKSIDYLWVISKGFAEHLQTKLGVNSEFLPVAIPSPKHEVQLEGSHSNVHSFRNIVYIGSVNLLYQDALRDLYECICELNAEGASPPFQLSMYTNCEPVDFLAMLTDRQYLDLQTAKTSEQRDLGLKSCFAAVLPYSFHKHRKVMVTTSFSCKVGELLNCGRPILVYGPAYASTPRYFTENNLPLVATNKRELKIVICDIANNDNPSTIARYLALADRHRPENVVGAVINRMEQSNL